MAQLRKSKSQFIRRAEREAGCLVDPDEYGITDHDGQLGRWYVPFTDCGPDGFVLCQAHVDAFNSGGQPKPTPAFALDQWERELAAALAD